MNVILRLFLNSGNATDLILSRAEAEQIVEAYKLGALKDPLTGLTADGVRYAVRVADVSVLVVLPVPEQEARPAAPQTIPLHGAPRFPARA